ERAIGSPLDVTEGLTLSYGGEQLIVLDLIHVLLRPPVTPGGLVPLEDGVAEHVACALGPQDIVLDLIGRVDPVPAVVVSAYVVRIFINNGEVIVNIAVAGVGADLAAPRAPAADRGFVAGDPAHGVDPVHGLLDDVIAAQPTVVVPVPHLVLHFTPAF